MDGGIDGAAVARIVMEGNDAGAAARALIVMAGAGIASNVMAGAGVASYVMAGAGPPSTTWDAAKRGLSPTGAQMDRTDHPNRDSPDGSAGLSMRAANP